MVRLSLNAGFNHYEKLDLPLPRDGASVSSQDIKTAYRQALLKHHPDKLQATPPRPEAQPADRPADDTYSIDQIKLAYKVLSSPSARAEYDRSLRLERGSHDDSSEGPDTSHPGLETVDLDDLIFDEAKSLWYRGCRCGESRGYIVSETDLEDAAADGTVTVGCTGCSLWLRVSFQVVPTEMDDAGDSHTESAV